VTEPERFSEGLAVKILVFVCFVIAAVSSATASADELETLVDWLTGSFSSAAQAQADSAYYDIRLEMVPIWAERASGHWLYVEQAAAGSLDRPYRQRVYQVMTECDGSLVSVVYALPEPLRFAGAWREPARFDQLTPDSLLPRVGCSVVLWRDSSGVFSGGTVGTECASQLRGAQYATSEVVVAADRIESWDRGFAAPDEQVWGAEKGPYIFLRIDEEADRPADLR
jgi:hypothetical protein